MWWLHLTIVVGGKASPVALTVIACGGVDEGQIISVDN